MNIIIFGILKVIQNFLSANIFLDNSITFPWRWYNVYLDPTQHHFSSFSFFIFKWQCPNKNRFLPRIVPSWHIRKNVLPHFSVTFRKISRYVSQIWSEAYRKLIFRVWYSIVLPKFFGHCPFKWHNSNYASIHLYVFIGKLYAVL